MTEQAKPAKGAVTLIKNVLMFMIAAVVAGVVAHLVKTQIVPMLTAPPTEQVGSGR